MATCAFVTFAIAAIPTHAIASSYYNNAGVSWCAEVFCGDPYSYGDIYDGSMYLDGFGSEFYYEQPSTYAYPIYTYQEYEPGYAQASYTYPTYNTYTYPTVYTYLTRPRRSNDLLYPYTPAQEYAMTTRQFNDDFARATAEWNYYTNYYAPWPL